MATERLSLDEYFLRMADLVSQRSTCLRRAVGCVIVNARGHVLATGYNGVAAGVQHCNEVTSVGTLADLTETFAPYKLDGNDVYFYGNACRGSSAESGSRLESCQAIHAEQNALNNRAGMLPMAKVAAFDMR